MAGLGPAFPTGKSQPLSRLVHTSKNWLWTADDSPSPIFFSSSTGIFVVWNQLYISLPHTSNRYHGNFVHVSMAILMGNDGPLPLGSREIPTSCRFASTNDGTKNGTSISTSSTSVYYSNTWWRTSHGSFLWVITPVIYMG